MSIVLRLSILFAGIALIIVILKHITRKKLREKQSLIWIFTGLGMIIISIIPQVVTLLAKLFGVSYAPSIIFVLGLVVVVFGLYYCYQSIFNLERRVDELTRQVSLLNAENLDIEEQLKMVMSYEEDTVNQ